MEILKLLSKRLRSIISDHMGQYSNVFKENLMAGSKTVVLDYLFGEGDDINAYQLVRFAESEPWNVLCNGYLLGRLSKANGAWVEVNNGSLGEERILSIGKFIDSQHFNLLPDKIKAHWEDSVQEVIMNNDSSYMVVCREGIEFDRFKLMFCSFIPELVKEEWAVTFKVYNAAFSDDFEIEVL